MKYIDVRVRVPARHLGLFVTELPHYAEILGLDKLEEASVANGHYKEPKGYTREPKKGTTAEAVRNLLSKKPCTRPELLQTLKEKKHKEKAISSALYVLVKRGLAKKQEDGTYASTQ